MSTKPVPEEFHTITPHLTVQDAARAIEFYREAFGARELLRNLAGDGQTIAHAELLLGDSRFFVNDEFPSSGTLGPSSERRAAVVLHLYVENADIVFEKAIRAGAHVLMPLENQPWGDRYGELRDPFGHSWSIASRLEDLSPRELKRRMDRAHAAADSQRGPGSPKKDPS